MSGPTTLSVLIDWAGDGGTDRVPNGSFETDTSGWDTVGGFWFSSGAGATIARQSGGASGYGSYCGEVTYSAVADQAATAPLSGTFRSGETYTATFWIRQATGSGNVQWYFGSRGTNDGTLVTNQAITGTYVQKTVQWSPSSSRTDAVLTVMSWGAITSTVRLDGVVVLQDGVWDDVTPRVLDASWERGANADLSGAAMGQATILFDNNDGAWNPGSLAWPVGFIRIGATYSATTYPQFTGRVERWSWDPVAKTVTATLYDSLRDLANTTVTIPTRALTDSLRNYRRRVIEAYAAQVAVDGATRRANYIKYGDFEGVTWDAEASLQWTVGTRNQCANGSFESATTGWAISGTGKTMAVASVAGEGVTGATLGSNLLKVSSSDGSSVATVTYDITGKFIATKTYRLIVSYARNAGGAPAGAAKLGSSGTPSDGATVTLSPASDLVARSYEVTWTPSADRTNARITLTMGGSSDAGPWYIDKVGVFAFATAAHTVMTATTLGTEAPPNPAGAIAILSAGGDTGAQMLTFTGSGVNPSGVCYVGVVDGTSLGSTGWTASVRLKAYDTATTMKFGLSYQGTDLGSTTFTPTYDWATYSFSVGTGHPISLDSANNNDGYVLYVAITSTSIRTVYVDNLRIEPGAVVSSSEPSWAELDNGWESSGLGWVPAGIPSNTGTADALLTAINTATGTRHWMRPTSVSPFFAYKTQARDTTPASSETISDDVTGSASWDKDSGQVANIVAVSYLAGGAATVTITSAASVVTYGPRRLAVDAGWYCSAYAADALADYLIAAKENATPRPLVSVTNRWPGQLARDVGDFVTLTFARLGISAATYRILKLSTSISEGGLRWETRWLLEPV